MKVSINLVTLNGKKYLPYLLDSLKNQTFRDFELLAVDNGSIDGTVEYFEKEWPQIKVVKNHKNIGFALAHNQAIKYSRGDYILMLNQDVVIENDFLEKIVNFMDKNDQIGAAQGKLCRWKVSESDGFLESEKTKIIDAVGIKLYKNFKLIEEGAGEEDKGQYNLPKEVFAVSGALPIFRRQALEDIKFSQEYFDELFISYKEDIDLSWRMRLRGWKIFYCPEAVAYHARGVSGKNDLSDLSAVNNRKNKSEFANYHSYKNHLMMLMKNLTAKDLLKYGIFIFWYELKKFVYLLFIERKTLIGLGVIIKNFSLIRAKRKFIMNNRKSDIEQWIN